MRFETTDGIVVTIPWCKRMAKRFSSSGPIRALESDEDDTTVSVPFDSRNVLRVFAWIGKCSSLRASGMSVNDATDLLNCSNWFGAKRLVSAAAIALARAVRADMVRVDPPRHRRRLYPSGAASKVPCKKQS